VIDLDRVETPAAVVDLERLDRNLRRWQEHCDRVGLANRPHVKTHRCVAIAKRQVDLGAAGITCQKLGEAEVMVDAGVTTDVLIPFNLVGAAKLGRLTALRRRASITVTVDDAALLPGLEGAAVEAGRQLGVLVDCDTGLGRTGVRSVEQAVELAAEVERRDGLRFDGLLTYPAPEGAVGLLTAAAERIAARGLEVSVVSVGGTPTMWASAELRPTVTEYRAGTYAFHDRATVAAGAATLEDVALTVHATVVSRPEHDLAIVDAGSKTLSSDPGPGDGFGLVLEAPLARIERLGEEHGFVRLGGGDSLVLGQRVRLVPNHACVVANLFDELTVVDSGGVVERWPVDARGRSA
jgi:D-serine deaminase-like pyridoxal phosphate-dependent protein